MSATPVVVQATSVSARIRTSSPPSCWILRFGLGGSDSFGNLKGDPFNETMELLTMLTANGKLQVTSEHVTASLGMT